MAGVDIRVGGSGLERMRALAADFKAAPLKMRREAYAALGRAAQPLGDLARQSAAETLPRGGGLAADVSKGMKIRVQSRFGANPRIKLVASQASTASSIFKKARRKSVRATRKRQEAWRVRQEVERRQRMSTPKG